MATLDIGTTTIVAGIYDDEKDAAAAAADAAGRNVAIGRIRRIDPGMAPGTGDAALDSLGLAASVAEHYRNALCRSRIVILMEVDVSNATAADMVLRQHRPLETAVHTPNDARVGDSRSSAAEADDPLPAFVRSTAAQNPRPRGHRDPSA